MAYPQLTAGRREVLAEAAGELGAGETAAWAEEILTVYRVLGRTQPETRTAS